MGYKKRGYSKAVPDDLVRDYKLFVIACEGERREPEYFSLFKHISSKIKVDIIEGSQDLEEDKAKEIHRSSPNWVLDRAMSYVDKQGLSDEDDLWFVIDVDRWPAEQIRNLAKHCEQHTNWNIAISNPCFEVWLYLHKKKTIPKKLVTAKSLKGGLLEVEKGGYHPYKFIPVIETAINNARRSDNNPKYFMPERNNTKVYQLAEELLKKVGKNDFTHYLKNKLPALLDKLARSR